MEILAARGNIAEALRVYEELRTLLREELGATPSPPIQALHVQLLKEADRSLTARGSALAAKVTGSRALRSTAS